MSKQISKNIRLGLIVLAGTALLIVALYIVGDKQNMFGSTFKLSAYFKNVNGLMVGHNVRFDGIDIGTVKNIEIVSDTSVRVDMAIELESQKFIKKNAIASIGTDGLMGNKLVNITPNGQPAPVVKDGDILNTSQPIEIDAAFKTLSRTNEDIAAIASNLKIFTEEMNSPNSLWAVLTDTNTADNIKDAIVNIKLTSTYASIVTAELTSIIKNIKSGQGTLGELLTDTLLITDLNATMENIQLVSDSLVQFTGNLQSISTQLLNGDGVLSTLLNDTILSANLIQTAQSAREGAQSFAESMEALRHSFLLRRYYKQKEKELERERKLLD